MRSTFSAHRVLLAVVMLATGLAPGYSVLAACEVSATFVDLYREVGPAIIGECQADEQQAETGDRSQPTTHGVLVWRSGDRRVVFTNGFETWLHGPNGLVKRLNTDRFAWESDPAPAPVVAVAPTATSIAVTAQASSTPTTTPGAVPQAIAPVAGAALPRIATALAALTIGRLPDIGGGFQLGGLSGLVALDTTGTSFVSITDRGPNRDAKVRGDKVSTFLLPTYSPRIVRLSRQSDGLQVDETIPLRLPRGTNSVTQSALISGLPNTRRDDPAYDADGRKALGTDPSAVDPEGIALDPRDGSYWICEEYGPSILHVARDGTILTRLVPGGLGLKGTGYDVKEILPDVLRERKPNRGFEGIGITPDGATVFAVMQSPLTLPNEKAGERSRNIRIISVDVSSEPRLTGMYLYQTETYAAVDADEQDDIKIGDLAVVSSTRLLLTERDSGASASYRTVYLADLVDATDIAGMTSLRKPLEQMEDGDLTRAKITPVSKKSIVDLSALGFNHELVEGLALIDPTTLAVVNDNNFDAKESSELMLIRLPAPLR